MQRALKCVTVIGVAGVAGWLLGSSLYAACSVGCWEFNCYKRDAQCFSTDRTTAWDGDFVGSGSADSAYGAVGGTWTPLETPKVKFFMRQTCNKECAVSISRAHIAPGCGGDSAFDREVGVSYCATTE